MPLTDNDKAYRLEHGTTGGRMIQDDGDVVNLADCIDQEVTALRTVTETQSAIHTKRAFALSGEGSVASAGKSQMLMKVGTKNVHFMEAQFDFSAGDIRVYLTEAPTISSNGTLELGSNMSREVPLVSPTALTYFAPTVTSEGTNINASHRIMPTANRVPATGSIANGRILNPNTDYLLTIENLNSSGTVTFSYGFTWHEI